MLVSAASVATEHAAIRLRQLCEHVEHEKGHHGAPEVVVTFNEQEGFVNFAPLISATCRLDARHDGVLVLEASAADQAALERVQRLITDHLERFGRTEGLTVRWDSAVEPPSTA